MANTTAQRERREAFVHKHRATFAKLLPDKGPYNPPRTSPEVAEFVNGVARRALGYAAGTDADSIWFTLHRAYRKLYPKGVPPAP